MKKQILLSLSFGLSFILSACGETIPEHPEMVFVTFKNYDNTVLLHTRVPYGSLVTYDGDIPYREPTESIVYTFYDWDNQVNTRIYKDTVYTACYTSEARKYIVQFLDYDGKLLYTDNVKWGDFPKYITPTRESDDDRIEYIFDGWDREIYSITSDTTYRATYKKYEYVYATFVNYNDQVLSQEKVLIGEVPEYSGRTPTRTYTGSDKKGYKFSGWDKNLSIINEDVTYKAKFDLLNIYTVTFKNYNNSILYTTDVYSGETATYKGSTPYRASTTSGDYIYNYTFTGWSNSLTNITSDLITTAQFRQNVVVYGESGIKNHLNTYGSGTYHIVSTKYRNEGTSSLGYGSAGFLIGFTSSGDLTVNFVIQTQYGDTRGTGLMEIISNGVSMFKCSYNIYFSNHNLSNMTVNQLFYSYYTTDEELSYVATLAVLASEYAVIDCTDYLESNDLSYIY